MILSIIEFILNVLAIYGWFTGNYVFVYIGGIFTLIVDIIGLFTGANRTIFLSIILPIIVGLVFFETSILGACAGICIVSTVFAVVGVLIMLITYIASKSKK